MSAREEIEKLLARNPDQAFRSEAVAKRLHAPHAEVLDAMRALAAAGAAVTCTITRPGKPDQIEARLAAGAGSVSPRWFGAAAPPTAFRRDGEAMCGQCRTWQPLRNFSPAHLARKSAPTCAACAGFKARRSRVYTKKPKGRYGSASA